MAKAIGYMKPDIDPNLRLYVPFNEGIGNVAKDYSQYGNHAQLTDVEWSPEGFNGAGKFNGSSSFGDCGNDASLNVTDAITIEAWVKPNVLSGNRVLIKKFTGTGNTLKGYIFKMEGDDFILSINNGVDGHREEIIAPDVLTTDWQHVIVVADLTGNGQLYRNGIAVGSAVDLSAIGDINTTDDLWIGKLDLANNWPFNGTIDEVRIYALALSAAQNAADCYEVVCS